jgi:hypothetical protein
LPCLNELLSQREITHSAWGIGQSVLIKMR